MSNEVIEKKREDRGVFSSIDSFEGAQRMAKMLSQSELVPKNFQNKLPDCVIALEIAMRTGSSPLFVMQNLYIVHGKPSWSSQFVISAVNSCGKFSPIRFQFSEDRQECYAWATELATGEKLDGPKVSIQMAKAEGWYQKPGSKWQTMPELMLRYRAATFFGRLYAPEILMGMRPVDEIEDIEDNKNKVLDIEIIKESHVNPFLEIKEEKRVKNLDEIISNSSVDLSDFE